MLLVVSPPAPMQTSPDVGGAGQNSLYRLHIRLVMIADHLVRLHFPPLDRSTKEGFGRSQIGALPQEHIHHLPPLIDGSIKVVLLAAPAEEELVHVPPPAQPPPIAV
jgi:hypothetical protein